MFVFAVWNGSIVAGGIFAGLEPTSDSDVIGKVDGCPVPNSKYEHNSKYEYFSKFFMDISY